MLYKEDWENSQQHFDAFWAGELLDRCCIAVTAPRNRPGTTNSELRQAKDLAEQWTDNEYRMEQAVHTFTHTYYGGEAFPYFWNNLGPGVLAGLIGGSYLLAETTVWFDREPFILDWHRKPQLCFDESSKLWKILCNMTQYFAEKSNQSYLVGLTDLGGNFDIAASLRGTEQLLYDLYDEPDEVKSLIEEIDKLWFECYERLNQIVSPHQKGVCAWMDYLWCRERWYPLQCDFAAMISPQMFQEFVSPALIRETKFLDRAVFHLDGPKMVSHLDQLLEIPGLTGIQWTPGDGNPGPCDEVWYPMYRKIQAQGKRLVLLYADDARGIENLLRNVSPKGLYISAHLRSEDEARYVMSNIAKWSV